MTIIKATATLQCEGCGGQFDVNLDTGRNQLTTLEQHIMEHVDDVAGMQLCDTCEERAAMRFTADPTKEQLVLFFEGKLANGFRWQAISGQLTGSYADVKGGRLLVRRVASRSKYFEGKFNNRVLGTWDSQVQAQEAVERMYNQALL